jgi:1,4-dihydroxy-2-naphthoate octaprenyltransferase
LAGVVLTAVLYVLLNYTGYGQFLFLLSLPLLWQNGLVVSRSRRPRQLAPMLRQTVLTTLVFVVTFGLGQLL